IERAVAAGVDRMLAIGTGDGPPDLQGAIRLAEEYPFLLATVGVHPHHARNATEETFAHLEELCTHPKVVLLGEIGLDYHYDFSPREVQREVFVRQLDLAARAGKSIVIHTREAWEDTMAILREHKVPGGVFHCFTGGAAGAEDVLGLGFCLGFGGVTTFPKSQAVRDAVKAAPLDRILIETDAPYLAPTPHRGARNEPAFLFATARCIASVRGTTLHEVAEATTKNFDRLCEAP
ncbi:MAG: TatD family hydrolase, partial [Bryobacteraceae bacterium]